jgi:hypothetical protein
MPRILNNAGFSEADIQTMLQNIIIEPTTAEGVFYCDALKGSKGHLLVNIDDTGVSAASFRKALYDFGSLVSTMIASGAISNVETKLSDYFMGSVPNEYFAGGLGIYILEKNNSMSSLRYLSMMLRAGMALTEIYIWEVWYGDISITTAVLRDEAQRIARDVWNKYFYRYFGAKDNYILMENDAMFIYPLMSPASAVGSITEMQVRDVIANVSSDTFGDNLFDELCRIYSIGKLTPSLWFKYANNRSNNK